MGDQLLGKYALLRNPILPNCFFSFQIPIATTSTKRLCGARRCSKRKIPCQAPGVRCPRATGMTSLVRVTADCRNLLSIAESEGETTLDLTRHAEMVWKYQCSLIPAPFAGLDTGEPKSRRKLRDGANEAGNRLQRSLP